MTQPYQSIERLILRKVWANHNRSKQANVKNWLAKMKSVLSGPGIRVRTGDGYSLGLEEIPQKPLKRRKMRILFISTNDAGLPHFSPLLAVNLLSDARIIKSDSFEQAEKKVRGAVGKAEKIILKAWEDDTKNSRINERSPEPWFPRLDISEVDYLEVVPTDAKPVDVKGKDFAFTANWGDWQIYSPNSDMQSHDPSYTYYSPPSAVAARKLYKIVKANPDVLKNTSWNDLDKFFAKNKVKFKTNFSNWS